MFSRTLSIVLLLCAPALRAATLDGQVVSFANGKAVYGATLTIWPRVVEDETMLPFDSSVASTTVSSDEAGRFTAEIPPGFAAIRVQRKDFVEYLNVLVNVNAGFVRIELLSETPSDAEVAVLEARRADAQAVARMDLDQPPPTTGFRKAADEPIVPTNVWVVNLEGYTGNYSLDEYIAGVVSLEMGDGFPYEALKAQAVAARTYALARLRDRGQANGGQAYTSTLGSRSSAAAYNSSGVALTYNSAFITAFFSARCNGDFTLDSEDGLSGLATCTPGGLTGGQVIAYLRKVPCSGHLNCSQTSEQCCHVTVDGRAQHLYGHGVGLCQRGAQGFAASIGFNWQAIVNRFYTSVTTLPGQQIRLADRVEMIVTANRRTLPCGGVTTSTPAGTKGTLIDGPQTIPCNLISGTSYITWWRVAFDNNARAWVAEDFIKKSPLTQDAPSLSLGIFASPTTAQITAVSRPNLRVVLEASSNIMSWTTLSTNTISVSGSATLAAPDTDAGRYFRARLLLPDTAP